MDAPAGTKTALVFKLLGKLVGCVNTALGSFIAEQLQDGVPPALTLAIQLVAIVLAYQTLA